MKKSYERKAKPAPTSTEPAGKKKKAKNKRKKDVVRSKMVEAAEAAEAAAAQVTDETSTDTTPASQTPTPREAKTGTDPAAESAMEAKPDPKPEPQLDQDVLRISKSTSVRRVWPLSLLGQLSSLLVSSWLLESPRPSAVLNVKRLLLHPSTAAHLPTHPSCRPISDR